MHSRRARPTLRLLAEDLTADWGSPRPRRLLDEGQVGELHPLSELPHPIIAKATEAFSGDPAAGPAGWQLATVWVASSGRCYTFPTGTGGETSCQPSALSSSRPSGPTAIRDLVEALIA